MFDDNRFYKYGADFLLEIRVGESGIVTWWIQREISLWYMSSIAMLIKGVRTDLLELAKLPYVKGFTARVFWEGGLKSIGAVAESDIEDILPLLIKVDALGRLLR